MVIPRLIARAIMTFPHVHRYYAVLSRRVHVKEVLNSIVLNKLHVLISSLVGAVYLKRIEKNTSNIK